MTDLRTAAQQALEALEAKGDAWIVLERKAIISLRAALAEHFCDTHCTWADHAPGCVRAEMVQEPVAWASKRTLDRIKDFDGTIYANGGFDDAVPLYAAPPQRKPLTDEVIADLWHQNGGFYHHFARDVERLLKGQE